MKFIVKPEITVEAVLTACISNLSDVALKDEYTAKVRILKSHENILERKIRSLELHTIPQNVQISAIANETALKKLYTDKLSKKGQLAREIYDDIMILAPNEKCPYCNHRPADTLDHFLPKANFPIYSITPINLLPACTQCNKGKLGSIPTRASEHTLHPYFDNIEDIQWLECIIVQVKKIKFEFRVKHLPRTDVMLRRRMEHHFASYGLNELYKSQASSEYMNIESHLKRIFNNKGKEELREFLFEAYLSRAEVDINSWQTALYKALHDNEDFIEGKFL
ncbi:HNH endonuclease [Flavobacterium sp. AG291]|uniref:HNH endonuclease n=1 Tax=Flavobacterium sp. AG291 TaxID=2184000 RepID=UPI000E0C593E|nr:hypothetical protein [Flavobacterium sp. AG291]RDI11265.1 hypothetical protein DEU42_106199 [Flavobacterium sp. AG291]